ncbi:MAG: hypothetical protein ACOYY2_03890 [Actinomycetota bacterium]
MPTRADLQAVVRAQGFAPSTATRAVLGYVQPPGQDLVVLTTDLVATATWWQPLCGGTTYGVAREGHYYGWSLWGPYASGPARIALWRERSVLIGRLGDDATLQVQAEWTLLAPADYVPDAA